MLMVSQTIETVEQEVERLLEADGMAMQVRYGKILCLLTLALFAELHV